MNIYKCKALPSTFFACQRVDLKYIAMERRAEEIIAAIKLK